MSARRRCYEHEARYRKRKKIKNERISMNDNVLYVFDANRAFASEEEEEEDKVQRKAFWWEL